MEKPIPPCATCIERQFNCHGGCSEYKKFQKDLEAYKEKIYEAKGIAYSRYVGQQKGGWR